MSDRKVTVLFSLEVDEVNWVQCDGPCEGWLHQLCAGIQDPADIEHLEKWFCPNCSNGHQGVEASVVGAAEALLSMAGLVEPSAVSVLDQVAESSGLDPTPSGGSSTIDNVKAENVEEKDVPMTLTLS